MEQETVTPEKDGSAGQIATNAKLRLTTPQAILSGLIVIAASIYISFGIPNMKGQIAGSTVSSDSKTVTPAVDDDPVLGRSDAPVTIIEFSDFQCPYCRRFWRDTFPELKKQYIDTGKVKLVYRDFPVSSNHPMAEPSARAGECAQAQDRFWQMHDQIFYEQDKLASGVISVVNFDIADLKQWARLAGLDGVKFDECLDSAAYKDEVQKDLEDGISAGVEGTPTFFINGKILEGAHPFVNFQKVIEAEIKNK